MRGTAAAAAFLLLAVPRISDAVPPKPSDLPAGGDRALMRLRADWTEARKWGMDLPHPDLKLDASMYGPEGAKRNTLVILMDFSDNQRSVPPENIESLLFSEGTYATGSMRDYYLENSYGMLQVQGQVVGWLRSERTYAYYAGGRRGLNFEDGDANARGMAAEALRLADPLVDFSRFDNDGPDGIPSSGDDDGYVDALMIVHAGPGSEVTHSANDILSHQGCFTDDMVYDGVRSILYTTEPEDGRVGVFCHEFGHTIGLPDLYDISAFPGCSVGLGEWSLMGTGVWLADGRKPAHLDAWSKVTLGLVNPIVPASNELGLIAPPVEEEPVVYKIWKNGRPDREYFLAEHRSRTGFDSELPGSGLLIYHVDESVRLQTDIERYKVAVEQADGFRQLETQCGNHGDTGDPFPGATMNTSFTPLSTPFSGSYDGRNTQVWISDIQERAPFGDFDSAIVFDLQVETSPELVLERVEVSDPDGDGDGIVAVGEPGHAEVTVRNVGLAASGVEVEYETNVPEISLSEQGVSVGRVEADSSFTLSVGFTWLETPDYEDTFEVPFLLAVSDGGFRDWDLEFSVGTGDGTGFADDFEGGGAAWTHAPASEGRADAWALTTAGARSGAQSWVFGGGGEGYPSLADGALTSPVVLLEANSQLVFFYRCEVESLGSSIAWDGCGVEISNNGGPWAPLEPLSGYAFKVSEFGDTPLAGRGVFSGSRDWTQVGVDLSGYSGSARFRFRFVSDDLVQGEGFYLDDVAVVSRSYIASLGSVSEVEGGVEVVIDVEEVSGPFDGEGFNVYRKLEGSGSVEGERGAPPGFRLLNRTPLLPGGGDETVFVDRSAEKGRIYHYLAEDLGPAGPSASVFIGPRRIYLCLGAAGAKLGRSFPNPFPAGGGRYVTQLVGIPDPECVEREAGVDVWIFDVAGRLVKRLEAARVRSGVGEVLWDGRDEDGDLVPSGVYLWRVQVAGQVLPAKVIVIR